MKKKIEIKKISKGFETSKIPSLEKNVIFGHFLKKKMAIFWQFEKKWQFSGIFWTFKWQFSELHRTKILPFWTNAPSD